MRALHLAGVAAMAAALSGCSTGPKRPPMPDMTRLMAVNQQLPAELMRSRSNGAAPVESAPLQIDTSEFSLGLPEPPTAEFTIPPELLLALNDSPPAAGQEPSGVGPRLALYDGLDASPVTEPVVSAAAHRESPSSEQLTSASGTETVGEERETGIGEPGGALAAAAEAWSRRELDAATQSTSSGIEGQGEALIADVRERVIDIAPVERWVMTRGDMLSEGLKSWADRAGWELVWKSRVDYRIASGLGFGGTIESAVEDLILLYSHAEKPLYADISPRQRLVVVSDDPKELGE